MLLQRPTLTILDSILTLAGTDASYFAQSAWRVQTSECPGDSDLILILFFGNAFPGFYLILLDEKSE